MKKLAFTLVFALSTSAALACNPYEELCYDYDPRVQFESGDIDDIRTDNPSVAETFEQWCETGSPEYCY